MTGRVAIILAFTLGMAAAGVAQADSYGHVQGATGKSENVVEAEKHMAAGEWREAIPLLEARNAGYPDEVETLADLGHSYAMVGELDLAVEKLKVALDLDPRHLEANLYLGETYLLRKDLPGAEAQLAALDSICFFGCGAYRQLKLDISSFKASSRP
jgi:Flp pilus assembly protein TadD